MADQGGTAKNIRPYVTAGIAACSASFVIHPIDLTKVRLQVVPPPVSSALGFTGRSDRQQATRTHPCLLPPSLQPRVPAGASSNSSALRRKDISADR